MPRAVKKLKKSDDDLNPQQRLYAVQLLSLRRQRLATLLDAQQQKWRQSIGELTREMNDLIDVDLPPDDTDCRHALEEIKAVYDEREAAKINRRLEIDSTRTSIARTDAAMLTIIHGDTGQMSLDLEDGQPRWLTSDAATQVVSALDDACVNDGANDQLDDLRSRLDELGLTGLQLAPADEDPVEDE